MTAGGDRTTIQVAVDEQTVNPNWKERTMSPTPTTDRVLYTTEAHVTGGREHGHGRTSDGALEVELRVPTEMGGEGGGTNPEELFAVGWAACFESALGGVARRQRLEADKVDDVEIDSRVMLEPNEERGFNLAAELAVTLPSIEDQDQAVDLVRAATHAAPTPTPFEATSMRNSRQTALR
jgi:osmotically inducible protein OsmC